MSVTQNNYKDHPNMTACTASCQCGEPDPKRRQLLFATSAATATASAAAAFPFVNTFAPSKRAH
jgi:hypothetical protein